MGSNGQTMKIQLQEFLFKNLADRNELRNWTTEDSSLRLTKVHVHRNHSFEMIASLISPHLALSGIRAEFSYSDYDDSFSLGDISYEADLVILWVDLSRYPSGEVDAFIRQRISVAITRYTVPVLLVTSLGILSEQDLPVPLLSTTDLEHELGPDFIDDRLEKLTGTRLSTIAHTRLAAEIGLKYIPAVLGLKIKCVILDLDNTIYRGVLGEDGQANLELTPGHRRLQEFLKTLVAQGILICIASKNDPRDVEALFEARTDFPLSRKDIFTVAAGWMPKSEIVATIEGLTNTHHSSYLFLDDNLGELHEVARTYPEMNFLHAQEDADTTLSRIRLYPGLTRLGGRTIEDSLRQADLIANAQRKTLQEQSSPEDYLKSLNVRLTIALDNPAHTKRLFELSNKTNQFIFSYARYTETQVRDLIVSKDSCVVSVSMRDKLSDSGLIAAAFITFEGEKATLEELVVSCRALGRGLDEIIVKEAVKASIRNRSVSELLIPFENGDRNEPARLFKETFLSNPSIEDILDFCVPQDLLTIQIED